MKLRRLLPKSFQIIAYLTSINKMLIILQIVLIGNIFYIFYDLLFSNLNFLLFVSLLLTIISVIIGIAVFLPFNKHRLIDNPDIIKKCTAIQLRDGYKQKFYEVETSVGGTVKHGYIYSENINTKLINNNRIISCKIDGVYPKLVKKLIKENYKQLSDILRLKMKGSSSFYNDPKLCLTSDLQLNENQYNEVRLHKLGYYDTFLTNIVANKLINNIKTNKKNPVANIFPFDNNGNRSYITLKNLEDSMMSNEIGVSTLAITRDNFIVIWTQNLYAQSSISNLVPSGSGSSDFSDLKYKNDFLKSIEFSTVRELKEENERLEKPLRDEDIEKSKVIGYFRWLNKAGKPEFVSITKINVNCNYLKPNNNEVAEGQHLKIEGYESLISDIEKYRKRFYGQISLPLHTCFDFLIDYYKSPSNDLKDYFNFE